MKYTIDIKGLKKDLPICKVSDDLYIGAFVIFGDTVLTVHCANELLKIAPEFDVIITPEAKAIPLAYEMARQSGKPYIVARKGIKAYMQNPFSVDVRSITTMGVQHLIIDEPEADMIKGKKVLIIDDVISTGASLEAIEKLVNNAGGIIVDRMAPLAEGDAIKRNDITFLAELPLFNSKGETL